MARSEVAGLGTQCWVALRLVIFDSLEGYEQTDEIRAIVEVKAPDKLTKAADTEHAERELKQYLQNEPGRDPRRADQRRRCRRRTAGLLQVLQGR